MSTASRNCGMVCGACGRWLNAAPAPGDSGATLIYYDMCVHTKIDGQLGGLVQLQLKRRKRLQNFVLMQPKSNPEAEIAVQWSFGSTSLIRFSPLRRAKLRHSPPLFNRARPPPIFFTPLYCAVLFGACSAMSKPPLDFSAHIAIEGPS